MIKQKLSIAITLLFFVGLMACNNSPQPVGVTTLTEITPSGGTNNGGVEITLTGTNIFEALTEDYEQNLVVTVCDAPLTNLTVIGSQTTVKAPNGADVRVRLGTSVTGTTSKVENPQINANNVVLTRPDGTSVTLEAAFVCNDAPTINTPVEGVLEIAQGAVDLDLSSIIQDPDGDPFIVSIEGLPAQLSFDASTLKLTGNFTNDDVGTTDITVKITDSDDQTKSYPIKLQVSDVNDKPVFNNASFTVQEAAAIDTVIGKVVATDVDDLQLTYKVLSGNTNNSLELNTITGQLTLKKELDHNVTASFPLQLEVKDPDGLTDTATVIVTVVRDTTVYNWTMGNPWPTNDPLYDVLNNAFASTLVPQLKSRSGNQINVTVADAPDFDPTLLDKVGSGSYDMAHTASYLYLNKGLANAFFTSQPFGLSEAQHKAWLAAEGQALWDELNMPHNLIAFRAGTSGEKAVGWFRNPISNPTQLTGLRWRVNGFGLQVAQNAGVNITTEADVGPLATALANGTIDAVRLSGPYADKLGGLHEAANFGGVTYYTGPDWAERNATLGLYVNLDKYNALAPRLKKAIRDSAEVTAQTMSSQYAALNAQTLQEYQANPNITVATFPQSVRNELEAHANNIKNAAAASDAFYAKVYESWKKYR